MARSDIYTLIPLDYWAQHYGLNMYRFNQINVPAADDCDPLWCQYAPGSGPQGRFHLRDALAQALKEAEDKMARYLGSPVAPDWVSDEQFWNAAGVFETNRFRVLRFGRPFWTQLGDYLDYTVHYLGDWAHVVIPAADYSGNLCDLHLVAPGYPGPCQRITYELRPVQIYRDNAGAIIIKAHKAQFVVPALWETCVPLDPDDPDTYLEYAEVWHVGPGAGPAYSAGEIVTVPSGCGTTMCTETEAVSCAIVNGVFDVHGGRAIAHIWPATYNAGVWTAKAPDCGQCGTRARLYYQCGVRPETANCCQPYERSVANAVARLATAYLPHEPCGCEGIAHQFRADRALMRTGEPMSSPRDPVAFQNPFGDSWAAQNAWNVCKSIRPNNMIGGGVR